MNWLNQNKNLQAALKWKGNRWVDEQNIASDGDKIKKLLKSSLSPSYFVEKENQ